MISEDRPLPYPSMLRAWYAVGILLLALTVSFIDRQILSLMVQPVRADLGLSDTELSLLHGFAFAIFYTVLGVPLGRWADLRNRRRMIVAGVVLWSLATAACGLADSFGKLFIARIFVGVGEAVLAPAAYSMIADYFPPARRARAMSTFSAGIFIGSGLALLLGGAAVQAATQARIIKVPLLGALHSWQAVFLIVGLPGLLVAGLMLTLREPTRQEVSRSDTSIAGAFAFVRYRATLLALISCGFALGGGTVIYGYAAWLPSLFIRVHHWQPAQAATAMGVTALTFGLAGVLAGGWLGDRAVRRGDHDSLLKLPALGMAGLIPAAALIGLAPHAWMAVAGFCWLSLLVGLPAALGVPALQAITPNQYRGQVIALYLLVANLIGLAIGPTLIAVCTDRLFNDDLAVGKSLALVTVAAAFAACALLRAARRRYRQHILLPDRGNILPAAILASS